MKKSSLLSIFYPLISHEIGSFGTRTCCGTNLKPRTLISYFSLLSFGTLYIIKCGCISVSKSLQYILTFPDKTIFKSEDLIRHFIRGYVDGDGTLGVYPHSKSNPKLEVSLLIVGTKSFLEGI